MYARQTFGCRLARYEKFETCCHGMYCDGALNGQGASRSLFLICSPSPPLQICLKTLINLSCPPGPLDAKMDELNDAALQVSLAFEESRKSRKRRPG